MSELNDLFAFQLKSAKLPYEREFRATQGRRWRWDFRIGNIVVDIQGGIWVNGGHVRGKQYQSDCEKGNCATRDGYRVLHFTADDVKSGRALVFIEEMG